MYEVDIAFFGANNPEVLRMLEDWMDSLEENIGIQMNRKIFLDNDPNIQAKKSFGLFKICGGYKVVPDLVRKGYYFINLVTGDTHKRYEVTKKLTQMGCKFFHFIHPRVDLPDNCLKNGAVDIYIQEHVILQSGVKIGSHVSIHTGAIIAHECEIGPHSFIAHGACLSGKVWVGTGVFIGANATILPRVTLGDWSVIGAGAVVTKDVKAHTTVVGNPAREIVRKAVKK